MTYLTKTRFKEAIECPDKLFYYRKDEWADNRLDNEFLQELAKSGIQVGELAKSYYPDGIEVLERDSEEALKRTAELLKKEQVIIFEGAFSFENLLVRVDILIKNGPLIELIEVKSKSLFSEKEIFTKSGITSDWKEYVYDIAFQFFVVQKNLNISVGNLKGFLYVIDKSAVCTIDGLYQKFRLKKDHDKYVVVSNPKMPLGEPLLRKVELTDSIYKIIQGNETINGVPRSFADYVEILSKAVVSDKMINSLTGRFCKACTYRANDGDRLKGLKSGYENCWRVKNGFKDEDFRRSSVFDIWNLHYTKLDQFLAEKRFFVDSLKKEDLQPKNKSNSKRKLTVADRQWLQIQLATGTAPSPYIDKVFLKTELDKLKFPLHFIDFEVAMNAIPFLKGLRPYHRLAFQFSIHTLQKDGKVSHDEQWIETKLGVDPTLEFIRQLRNALTKTEGSILIYSSYENSILLHILNVINESTEFDKAELIKFIKAITWCDGEEGWTGSRAMIDMREWVLESYLSSHMKQSNSLKVVLPAIINDSSFLRTKYEKGIYGSETMTSLNFKNFRWVNYGENGQVENPYKYLPPVFDGLDREAIEQLFEEDDLADGGAAMSAYNLMQFMEMTDLERKAIINALYKYCELDTLAMVMLYEGLNDLLNSK